MQNNIVCLFLTASSPLFAHQVVGSGRVVASATHASSGDWASDGTSEGAAPQQQHLLADLLMLRQRCERQIERLLQQLARASRDDKPPLLEQLARARSELADLCNRLMPDTTGDLLSNYVNVWVCRHDTEGFHELAHWLGLDEQGVACQAVHCAQTQRGTWRILDDANGTELQGRPPGFTECVPMSIRSMSELGLHPISSHRIISSRYVLDFRECTSWDHVESELNNARHLFTTLRRDGWSVDNCSYSADEQQLFFVKHLAPLKTLQDEAAESVVDGASVLHQTECQGPRRMVSRRSSGGGNACRPPNDSGNRSSHTVRRASRPRRRRGPQAGKDSLGI